MEGEDEEAAAVAGKDCSDNDAVKDKLHESELEEQPPQQIHSMEQELQEDKNEEQVEHKVTRDVSTQVEVAEVQSKENPQLSLEDSIAEFCDYLVFAFEPSKSVFKRGTVFYHVKCKDEPHHVYTFGFTVDADGLMEPSCKQIDGDASRMKEMSEKLLEPESSPRGNNASDLCGACILKDPDESEDSAQKLQDCQTSSLPRNRYPYTARHYNQERYVRVLPWSDDLSDISGPKYDIRLNEQEFRDVFSGNISVSQLTNSILSGRIYVSPWHMQSVYNFASSFPFDRWDKYYTDLAARKAETDEHLRHVADAELESHIQGIVDIALSQALAEITEEPNERLADVITRPNSDCMQSTTSGCDEAKFVVNDLEILNNSVSVKASDQLIDLSNSPSLNRANERDDADQVGTVVDVEPNGELASLSLSAVTMIAGSFANSVEALIMHPLDLVKTRFQLASRSSVFGLSSGISNHAIATAPSSQVVRTPRLSVASQFRKILHESPPLPGKLVLSSAGSINSMNLLRLWRGSAPAVAMQAPRGALKFTVTSQVEENLGGLTNPRKSFIAGAAAGMTESVFITPFELVKVRLQAYDKISVYSNTFGALQNIFKREGPVGFWRGLESTLWRNGSWNAAYFGCIGFVNSIVEKSSQADFLGEGLSDRMQSFIAGTVGGSVGACFSTPLDVAKSRIQNTVIVGGSAKVRTTVPWTLPVVAEIARTEGLRGLYRGFVPKLLRLGPGGGILLLAFDWANAELSM